MFRKKQKNDVSLQAPVLSPAALHPFNPPAAVTRDGRAIPPAEYGPLQLAFIGDAVYSLIAREILVRDALRPAGELHRLSTELVNAKSQAEAYVKIEPLLTEEEKAVFRHGRNAKTSHTPKNQTGADYSRATGMEALFGYLYLAGKYERLTALSGVIFTEKAKHEKEN